MGVVGGVGGGVGWGVGGTGEFWIGMLSNAS